MYNRMLSGSEFGNESFICGPFVLRVRGVRGEGKNMYNCCTSIQKVTHVL